MFTFIPKLVGVFSSPACIALAAFGRSCSGQRPWNEWDECIETMESSNVVEVRFDTKAAEELRSVAAWF